MSTVLMSNTKSGLYEVWFSNPT